jgi:hypothetical protein
MSLYVPLGKQPPPFTVVSNSANQVVLSEPTVRPVPKRPNCWSWVKAKNSLSKVWLASKQNRSNELRVALAKIGAGKATPAARAKLVAQLELAVDERWCTVPSDAYYLTALQMCALGFDAAEPVTAGIALLGKEWKKRGANRYAQLQRGLEFTVLGWLSGAPVAESLRGFRTLVAKEPKPAENGPLWLHLYGTALALGDAGLAADCAKILRRHEVFADTAAIVAREGASIHVSHAE